MKTQSTHTPTPWKVAESVVQKDCWYLEGLYQDQWIAIGDDDGTMDYDDAAFIVRVVNAYGPMVDLIRRLAHFSGCYANGTAQGEPMDFVDYRLNVESLKDEAYKILALAKE